MSDYLRGVVTRALAPARVLRPRAPMPFESLRTASEEIVISTSEPRGATESRSQAPVAAQPSSTIHVERSPVFRGRHAFASLRAEASRHDASNEPGAVNESITTPSAESAERAPSTRVDVALQTRAVRRIETNASVKNADHDEPVIRSLVASDVSALPGRIAQPGVQPLAAAHTPPVHRLPVTRLPRERAREDARAMVAAAPIEITIGRIDVRAVMPSAAPPAKPRFKAAAMSLDDYLASRGGRE